MTKNQTMMEESNKKRSRGLRPLSRVETVVYLMGGVLMVVGSGAHVLMQQWGAYLYALGAIAFSLMQMKQRYDGESLAIRRLRKILVTSDVFFLLAAVLMFAMRSNFLGLSQIAYVEWVWNKWVVALLAAAVLQLYAGHRLSTELAKEQGRED